MTISRYAIAILAGSLLLNACADKNTQPSRAGGTPSSRSGHAASSTSTGAPKSTRARPAAHETSLPSSTGIAACDDYLSSYLACHRAAHIYAPEQLQTHYQAIRTSLLRDSQNPDIRPQLGQRCSSLTAQLREVLRGQSCGDATGSSTVR